ncbi:DUF58 domain-containing protein [Kitasatospora sp. NPDC001175]|uniref:DUF58 domain-containing protein n=1 Tax=Kitasatospora sp. NPDC001175 TaxID=3157103 RepID=UPI003D076DB2
MRATHRTGQIDRSLHGTPRDRSLQGTPSDQADRRSVVRALGPAPASTPAALPAEPPPHWRASERALRLATVSAVAGALALLTGRSWLLALAAGPAVLLILAAAGRSRPARLEARAQIGRRRAFEDDTIDVRIELSFDGVVGWVDPGVYAGPGIELGSLETTGTTVELRLTARRWGRWSLGAVDLDVYDRGGLTRRTVRVDLGEVQIFPTPSQSSLTPVQVRLPERIGEHTAGQSGEGVEVAGVRPYVWGERQRRIHWPSTSRRGTVQVNQFVAERTADIVVLIDAFGDFLDPTDGTSSLDETLRAAAGITRAYLRSHDRVGVVSVGGSTHWVKPGSGAAQFYRLVESVLEVRRDLGYHVPDIPRLPRPVIPADALVYVLTPLGDQRILDVLHDLTERGNPLVVIEVPTGDPELDPNDTLADLALQLWHANCEAVRFTLRSRGIPVLGLRPGEGLDLALAPLQRARIRGRNR